MKTPGEILSELCDAEASHPGAGVNVVIHERQQIVTLCANICRTVAREFSGRAADDAIKEIEKRIMNLGVGSPTGFEIEDLCDVDD